MNEKELLALYNSLKSEYELGSIDEFKSYLSDEGNRLSFYNEVIQPQYDVDNFSEFEEIYGLKKKDSSKGFGQEKISVSDTEEDTSVILQGDVNEESQKYIDPVKKLREISATRGKGMDNGDGSFSTVLLSSAIIDGKNIVYPTLFKDGDEFISLSGDAAIDRAFNEGEVVEVATAEEADSLAKGSWKGPSLSPLLSSSLEEEVKNVKDPMRKLMNSKFKGNPSDGSYIPPIYSERPERPEPPTKAESFFGEVETSQNINEPMVPKAKGPIVSSEDNSVFMNTLTGQIAASKISPETGEIMMQRVEDGETQVAPGIAEQFTPQELAQKQVQDRIDILENRFGKIEGLGIWANAGSQLLSQLYPEAFAGSEVIDRLAQEMQVAYKKSIGLEDEDLNKSFTQQDSFKKGAQVFAIDVANAMGLSALFASSMGTMSTRALAGSVEGLVLDTGLKGVAKIGGRTIAKNLASNPGSFIGMGYVGSNMAYKEVKNNPTMSEFEKIAYATFGGLKEMFTEAGFVGDFRAWNNSLSISQRSVAEDSFKSVFRDYTKALGTQGIEEGTEEGISWLGDYMWKYMSGEELPTPRSAWEAMAVGFFAPGSAVTSQFAAPLADYAKGGVLNKIFPYTLPVSENLRDVSDLKKQKSQIEKDLKTEGLEDLEIKNLEAKKEEIDSKLLGLQEQSMKERENMSPLAQQALFVIDAQIQGLYESHQKAKTGSGKKAIKERVQELLNTKAKIDGGIGGTPLNIIIGGNEDVTKAQETSFGDGITVEPVFIGNERTDYKIITLSNGDTVIADKNNERVLEKNYKDKPTLIKDLNELLRPEKAQLDSEIAALGVFKIDEDAIQESSTESVDVQEQAGASEGVREGDTKEQEISEEITSEVQEPNVSEQTQEESITLEKSAQSEKVEKEVATNKTITINYNRNLERAPDMGEQFGQDVEAAGTYVTQKEADFTPKGFETGTVQINNPLVIDVTSDTQIEYKRKLSEENEGKTGVELANALKEKGFDAIVTKNEDGTTGEIVLLNDISTYKVDQQTSDAEASVLVEKEVAKAEEDIDMMSALEDAEIEIVTSEVDIKTLESQKANAEKSISKILPNTKIIIHSSTQEYKDATNNSSGRGKYITKEDVIHINAEQAQETTIPHEVFHAIFLNAMKTEASAAASAKKMMESVRETLDSDSDLAKQIDKFAENYSENIKDEERLSQLFGIISSEYAKLTPKAKSSIVKFIEALAAAFKVVLPKTFGSTDKSVMDLLDVLAQKTAQGETIREKDVAFIEEQVSEEAPSQVVKNPAKFLDRLDVGAFEVTYTERDNTAEYIKDGKITEPKTLDFLDQFFTTITSPDDMLAGEIKYKGKIIFEGEGGIFFVTKFGDVWASGKEGTANTIANSLNKQLKLNGDKAFLTLTKGSDSKLVSSASGVNSTLSILSVMLDEGLISPSSFRSAVSSTVKKAGGDINLRKSAKDLKSDIKKYFNDPSTTTFEKRGFVIKDIVGELAKTLPKESQAAIAEFLGGDASKGIAKNKTILSQSFVDLFAKIAAEDLTKGLNIGDIYGVIEINSEVEVKKDKHPSYPFHISLKNGNAPILHLPQNRESGSNVLVQKNKEGDYKLDYAVRNLSVVEGQYSREAAAKAIEEGTERRLKPKTKTEFADREQKIDDNLSKASGRTQRKNTRPSYVNAANIINDLEIKGDVLDYGAGLGVGTDAMTDVLGREVDSFEINTERWEGEAKPTYTSAKDIDKKYDSIVSLNVVNVVPKDVRDFIVTDIFEKLNEGGTAFISSRGFKGDVANAKNFELGPEEKSYLIKVSGDQQYQKGFDGNELVNYIQDLLGEEALVVKDNNTFGKTGVIVTKLPQSRQQKSEAGPKLMAAINLMVKKGYSPEAIELLLTRRGFDSDIIEAGLKKAVKPEASKENLEELNKTIDKSVKRQKEKGGNRKRLISSIDKKLRESKEYKQADDATKKRMEANARARADEAPQRAASRGRILGAIKNIDKISEKEKLSLAQSLIELQKDAAKDLALEIRGLAKLGSITPSQVVAAISRISKVNFLNEISVKSYVDYMAKVFADAQYAEEMNEIRKTLPRAIKNIQTKLGISSELIPTLTRLFGIDPTMIPDSAFKDYLNLVNMFSQRGKVLKLEDKSKTGKTVNRILNALSGEYSLAQEVSMILESYKFAQPKQVEGKSDSEILKTLVKENILTPQMVEVYKKYKGQFKDSVSKTTKKTEEELTEEKIEIIQGILESKLNWKNLNLRDERDLAKKLSGLIKKENLESLTTADLNNLAGVIDNINNGYLPHVAQLLKEKIEGVVLAKVLLKAIQNANPLKISKAIAKLKTSVMSRVSSTNKRGAMEEMIRRTPLSYIDQIFGNFKGTPIYDSVLKSMAEGQAALDSEYKKISQKVNLAEASLLNSNRKSGNKTLQSKFRIQTYLLQLEYESNRGNSQVQSAKDILEVTIDNYQENSKEREYLEGILENYSVDGRIDLEKLNKSFTPQEKKLLNVIQQLNASLTERAMFTAAIIRGDRIDPINNYVHHNVLLDQGSIDPQTQASDLIGTFIKTRTPSTKAKTLTERTPGVKPLNFDVVSSALRGAKFVLTDYYLTSPLRTTNQVLNIAEKTPKPAKERSVLLGIKNSFKQAADNTLSVDFMPSSIAQDFFDYLKKQGYRVMLASIPRSAVELTSNVVFAAINDPASLAKGTSLSDVLFSKDASNIMTNVKSVQTGRIYPKNKLSGRLIETINESTAVRTDRASKTDALGQVKGYTLDPLIGSVEYIADNLVTSPDKIIMRTVWFGKFATTFKQETGSEPDFEAIRNNDEAYLNKYEKAIEVSKTKADTLSIEMGASDNPFLGILKGAKERGQDSVIQSMNMFNNFMQRFLIYEFNALRKGVHFIAGQGDSRRKGAAIITASLTRMTMYSYGIKLVKNAFDGLIASIFGIDIGDDEDDKSQEQAIAQALLTTFTTIILGRDMGNFAKLPVALAVEDVNEKYLDFLREGPYNKYEDQIQYSLISPEKGKPTPALDVIVGLSGPYAPAIKSMIKAYEKLTEAEKKQVKAVLRAQREVNERLPLEVLGTLGLIPFYSDVRRIYLKNLYKDMKKGKVPQSLIEDVFENIEVLQGVDDQLDEVLPDLDDILGN